MQQLPRESRFKLPEYLEMSEVNALIAAAPNPRARLVMLEQWWARAQLVNLSRSAHLATPHR